MTPTTRIDLQSLDRERWRRLEAVLEEVLDLPRGEQPAALDRLCGGDAGLKAQIEALLDADRGAESFLSKPALEMAASFLDPAAGGGGAGAGVPGAGVGGASAAGPPADAPAEPGLEGARVGPYRLLREIGRGGMGRVYLAERADGQFEQRVAIKLLKRGLDTDEILARFLQERQILARLEHPLIARLLDGGVTGDGLPWFALEHVDGTPLTEYCERRGESLTSALRLFAEVCRAVQFAHRNLVIHRDLKPSNILVSERGEVKLLDFGIAKLLDPAGEGEMTLGPSRAMTPVYAAPEQVRGEPPTTATDVYALGIVLYELLTGERPFRKRTGAPEEARRAVLDEVPEAPSARLRRAGTPHAAVGGAGNAAAAAASGAAAATSAAATGSPAPGRRSGWARLVRGDLDNIVLKAVRKEPEERYASAEALVEDIGRYLDGQPVRASGRRAAYVARKFVRRNRVAVAAAAVVLASLAGGLIATAWQARIAARERDHARLEAKKAAEIKDFTLGLFKVSDPLHQARADRITARELLDQGAERVERELAGEPDVQAEMWDLLASVYRDLGLFGQAVSLHERALRTRRVLHPGDHPLVAASLTGLGTALVENGEYARAEPRLREAVAMETRLHGPMGREVAHAMSELAVLYNRSDRAAQSESLYYRIIAIDSASVGMTHVDTASDLSGLGMTLLYDGRSREALPYLRRALAIRQRLLGRNHPDTATEIDNVASCMDEMGQLDSVITLRQEVLAIRRHWFAPDHPDIAFSLANLGISYWKRGDFDQAEDYQRQAIEIRHRILDPKDPFLGQSHNDLATAYFLHGKRDSAEVHFRTALAIWDGALPPDHRFVLTARNNLGVVLREEGRYGESEKMLRDVLARRIATLGPDHFDVSHTSYNLGKLLRLRGKRAEAETLLRRALAIRERALDAGHPKVAETQEALATLYRDEGRYRESAALYDSALATCRARFPTPNPETADVLVGKGRALIAMKRAGEAEPLLREALAIRETALMGGDARIAEAQVALGLCLAALGKSAEARPLLGQGVPILARQPGRPDPILREARAALR